MLESVARSGLHVERSPSDSELAQLHRMLCGVSEDGDRTDFRDVGRLCVGQRGIRSVVLPSNFVRTFSLA